MNISLKKATVKDAKGIQKIQRKAFERLYITYQDANNPYNETLAKIKSKLKSDNISSYLIQYNGNNVGMIQINNNIESKTLHRLFIVPEYQNKGIAQQAIGQIEEIHGKANWQLDTILQEKGNCHLYEKMGYSQTGKTEIINDKLTIVFYKK